MDVAGLIVFLSLAIVAVLVFFIFSFKRVKQIQFEEKQREDIECCFRENIMAQLEDIEILLESVLVDSKCNEEEKEKNEFKE